MTAYWMRISVWSSDVCSSYLAADADAVLVLQGALLQRRQHAVHVGQQDVGRLRQLHGKAGVQHVGGGHALVHEARLRPHVLGEVGEEGDDVVPGLRSEEHTSELQSLMRISYAVFCLQKKKSKKYSNKEGQQR